MKLFPYFLFCILFVCTLRVSAQCPDGSTATLSETTEWIATKIEAYGGRLLPPTRYEVSFANSIMTLYEFGIDADGKLTDTVVVITMNLKDIDLPSLKVRYIGKAGSRFALSFNGKMKCYSPTLGEVKGGYEVILDCDPKEDLANRLIKAITHGYCLSGGSGKEKF